jgi:hypothetical protein
MTQESLSRRCAFACPYAVDYRRLTNAANRHRGVLRGRFSLRERIDRAAWMAAKPNYQTPLRLQPSPVLVLCCPTVESVSAAPQHRSEPRSVLGRADPDRRMFLALTQVTRDGTPPLRKRARGRSRRWSRITREEVRWEVARNHPVHRLPAATAEGTPERHIGWNEPSWLRLDGSEERLLTAQVLLGECSLLGEPGCFNFRVVPGRLRHSLIPLLRAPATSRLSAACAG